MQKSLSCALLVVVCSCTALAGTAYVKNISFTLPGSGIYADGDFQLASGGTAGIQTYNAAPSTYEYAIDNLTLTFSPCALIDDRSTPGTFGRIIGDFAGGGMLTFSGDLRASGTSTVLYSGKILEGQMQIPASQTWVLQQQNAFVSQLTAVVDMLPADGGLASGIDLGSDVLKISSFSLGMSFFLPTTIESFEGNNSITLSAPNLLISAVVPEPATLALVGLGLCLMRRKK